MFKRHVEAHVNLIELTSRYATALNTQTTSIVGKRYNPHWHRCSLYCVLANMFQEEETLLLMKPNQRRHRPLRARWSALEKALVEAFAARRAEGKIVRHKWFERTSKALFKQLYPTSPHDFKMSEGWFGKFLSRNEIAIRVVTNKAQQPPEEYCDIIVNFLCFNRRNSQLRDGAEDVLRRNSQLRDGAEDALRETVLAVGRYLLSHILNMDQTPLPWEYITGRTYEFKGSKTVWVRSKKSGWDKRQATIQLTIFADGVARVKPLIIFRGAEEARAPRKKEEAQYDPRVVTKFNPKGYANNAIILFWLETMLLPALGDPHNATLLVMDLLKSHKTDDVKGWLRKHNITPSLVPAGCTGLVQPLDVSVNRPFKDLLKQVRSHPLSPAPPPAPRNFR